MDYGSTREYYGVDGYYGYYGLWYYGGYYGSTDGYYGTIGYFGYYGTTNGYYVVPMGTMKYPKRGTTGYYKHTLQRE